MLPPPRRKVGRLRAALNRYSLPLLYITSGVMLARMAVFYYKYKTGAKVFITKEEMQPDEEVTKKILYWMEKLGLNQTTWDDPRGRRK